MFCHANLCLFLHMLPPGSCQPCFLETNKSLDIIVCLETTTSQPECALDISRFKKKPPFLDRSVGPRADQELEKLSLILNN